MNENFFYAQLDENNICVGVSSLSAEVPEINHIDEQTFDPITEIITTENKFVSRMIKVPYYSNAYIGLKYNNGKWEAA